MHQNSYGFWSLAFPYWPAVSCLRSMNRGLEKPALHMKWESVLCSSAHTAACVCLLLCETVFNCTDNSLHYIATRSQENPHWKKVTHKLFRSDWTGRKFWVVKSYRMFLQFIKLFHLTRSRKVRFLMIQYESVKWTTEEEEGKKHWNKNEKWKAKTFIEWPLGSNKY